MKTIIKILLIAVLTAFVGLKLFAGGACSGKMNNPRVAPAPKPNLVKRAVDQGHRGIALHRWAVEEQENLEKAAEKNDVVALNDALRLIADYKLERSREINFQKAFKIALKHNSHTCLPILGEKITYEHALAIALAENNAAGIKIFVDALKPKRNEIANEVNAHIRTLPEVLGFVIADYAL